MKRDLSNSAQNMDADILQCKAELKSLREKLMHQSSGASQPAINLSKTDSNTIKSPEKPIKIIEVKPLEASSKKTPEAQESNISAKIPAFEEILKKDTSSDQKNTTAVEEIDTKNLEDRITRNLIEKAANSGKPVSKDIPVFDLSSQMMAKRREASSAKRVAPVRTKAQTVDDAAQKRGIEAVIAKGITEKAVAEVEEIKPISTVEPVAEEKPTLADELKAVSAADISKQLAEEIETAVESSDKKITNSELAEISRVTQEELDCLRLDTTLEIDEDIDLDEDPAELLEEEICVGLEKVLEPSEKTSYGKRLASGRFSRLEKNHLAGKVQQLLSDLVATDISKLCNFGTSSNVKVVRYVGL